MGIDSVLLISVALSAGGFLPLVFALCPLTFGVAALALPSVRSPEHLSSSPRNSPCGVAC